MWAAAGPVGGLVVGTFFFRDFAARAVPELDRYCQNRVSRLFVDKLMCVIVWRCLDEGEAECAVCAFPRSVLNLLPCKLQLYSTYIVMHIITISYRKTSLWYESPI